MSSKPKRLVLCFDGTWGTLASPTELTNVVKLAEPGGAQSDGDIPQIVYYNSGVGTGGPIDKLLGGAFGVGLKANVKRGLAFLDTQLPGRRRDLPVRLLARRLHRAGPGRPPRPAPPAFRPTSARRSSTGASTASWPSSKDQAGRYPRGHPKRVPFDD